MEKVRVDEFSKGLRSGGTLSEPVEVYVENPDHAIPVFVFQCPAFRTDSVPLVVCFHGAVDRSKRKIPAFEGPFLLANAPSKNAFMISFADPLLARAPDLRAAWYAGAESLDLPMVLKDLIGAMRKGMNSSRVVFVGGSTGAHAALTQSFYLPGSVVVVENPILHIGNYTDSHLSEYRAACWPQLGPEDPLPAAVTDNVARLYMRGSRNTAIILNNARDLHFWRQAVEFLFAVRSLQRPHNVMVISEYFSEYAGHSYPAAVWARWIRAACEAASTAVKDVGERARQLEASAPVAAAAAKAERGIETRDVEIARKIHQLSLAQES